METYVFPGSLRTRPAGLILGFFLVAACVLLAPAALSAPGDLDPTFGEGGKVHFVPPYSAEAHDVAIQDGNIIVVGESGDCNQPSCRSLFLARYLRDDGSPDDSFGNSGQISIQLGGRDSAGHSIEFQSDGKFVVAGGSSAGPTSPPDFTVARFLTNGTLDLQFGEDGFVTTGLSPKGSSSTRLAVQQDGKIVAVGALTKQIGFGESSDLAIVRYNPDGSLDDGGSLDTTPGDSFGEAGKKVLDVTSQGDDKLFGVAIENGKILAAGSTDSSRLGEFPKAILLRLNGDGSSDTSFGGGDGVVILDPTPLHDELRDIAVQPDGRIVAAGFSGRNAQDAGDFFLARFDSSGNLDPGFGLAGQVIGDFGGCDYAGAVAIQPDGKIVVGGSSAPPHSHWAVPTSTLRDYLVARYSPEGILDPAFGIGGHARTGFAVNTTSLNLPTSYDEIEGLGLMDDGRIVVAGSPAQATVGIARFLGGGALSIEDKSIVEGNSSTVRADFTITLDEAPLAPVTVNYTTENGTAIAPEDYEAASGTLTFAAGEKTRSVSVPVRGDTVIESDETFSLKLTTSTVVGINDNLGVATIKNDDGPTPPSRGAPVINSIRPDSGDKAGGTSVVISGTGLAGATQINFGNYILGASQFSIAGDSAITLSTPPHTRAEQVPVTVTNAGGTSNALPFTYTETAVVPAPPEPDKQPDSNSVSSGLKASPKGLAAVPASSGNLPPVLPVTSGAPGSVTGSATLSATSPVSAGVVSPGAIGVPSGSAQLASSGGLAASMDKEHRLVPEHHHAMVRHVGKGYSLWPPVVWGGLSLISFACCMLASARRPEDESRPAVQAAS